MRALITGGAGFIGSHLADALLSMKNRILIYDNFDNYYSGKEDNIQHNLNNPRFRLIQGDILDFETLLRSMRKVDVVFHLAAQPGVRFSVQNPDKTTTVNILGTLNVLRASDKTGVKKVVFVSTSSVYGHPKRFPVDEKHQTEPISIYGASKLVAEKYCKIFNDQQGLPVVILRYHTVYGPRQRPDMAINKWTNAIFEGNAIKIYGDGKQTRDFTYISDCVDGTIKAAETDGIEGEVFNLGNGKRTSVNETVRLLVKISDVENVQIIHEPPKLGDVRDTHADISKARRLLDFYPKVRLEEGLKLYVKWYKNRFLSG